MVGQQGHEQTGPEPSLCAHLPLHRHHHGHRSEGAGERSHAQQKTRVLSEGAQDCCTHADQRVVLGAGVGERPLDEAPQQVPLMPIKDPGKTALVFVDTPVRHPDQADQKRGHKDPQQAEATRELLEHR